MAAVNNGSILNCYTTGSVSLSDNGGDVGGFVGENSGSITNCYTKATVGSIFEQDIRFGGFVGYATGGSIAYCYSTGSVSNMSGGFCGAIDNTPTFTNCFWDTGTSDCSSSAGGTGETTTHMTNASTTNNIYLLAGWDFKGESANGSNEIWNIGNGRNNGYPYLSWEYPSDPATLPVTLSAFTGIYTASNTVSLVWTTQSESNMIGYQVLRADDQNLAHAHRVNDQIIQALNLSTEHSYSYTDQTVAENSEYYYWLQSAEMDGSIQYHGPVKVNTGEISVTPPPVTVNTKLNDAYPNPFNPSTTLSFEIVSPENVIIDIYNAKGQYVKNIVNSQYQSGKHSIIWDGQDAQGNFCGTGIFYYQMKAGKFIQTKKMMLIK